MNAHDEGKPNAFRLDTPAQVPCGSLSPEDGTVGDRPWSATLTPTGCWEIAVSVRVPEGGIIAATLPVAPAQIDVVTAEPFAALPEFAPDAPGWGRGLALSGVRAQECTARHALDPDSLRVTAAPGPDAAGFAQGPDYDADLEWGTVGRVPTGGIAPDQPVYLSYRYGTPRLDSVVLGPDRTIVVRQGVPHIATPCPPDLAPGETRLANLFIEARQGSLDAAHLFPIMEEVYPEPEAQAPSAAERLLPKTFARLMRGESLRILAWGDSVTEGSFLPGGEGDRWQNQFVELLRRRFPSTLLTLITEAWGGRNTASYLAEPPGAPHNYREKVLGPRPDLIVSEFVNDAGLAPGQVTERYDSLLADFQATGAEWIILTPHYVRPDWMGLTSQRDIDEDPRSYVHALRDFATRRQVALADASRRWGRLWRQGLPYNTLMHNTINHPNAYGMRIFADSLMALFP